MENEMLAVETMKVEVEEVKLETSEMNNGPFGVDQITWELAVGDCSYDNAEKIYTNRIKNEHNYAKPWMKCDWINKDVVKMQNGKIKLEKGPESEESQVAVMIDEVVIKNEDDSGTFMDENAEITLDSTLKRKDPKKQHPVACEKINTKSFSCYDCNYTTYHKYHLINHMKQHKDQKSAYRYGSSNKVIICIHCNDTFKNKQTFDDHMIEKHPNFMASSCRLTTCIFKNKFSLGGHTVRKHPNFIEYVSSKIHECKCCAFKTTYKRSLTRHMFKHPEAAIYECTHCTYKATSKSSLTQHMFDHPETSGSHKLRMCKHCNATFKTKFSLDDHTIRKHPDFIGYVSSKIHKCTHCTFKTTHKTSLTRHVFKHPETAIYKCTHCTYKATSKISLTQHMLDHPDTSGSYEFRICEHCNATFKTKFGLDDHIIRKHPNLIGYNSRKIHACTHCEFRTTHKSSLTRHMFKHPETAGSCKRTMCVHCNATFHTKQSLHEHTIKKHPDFIDNVCSKIHECAHCPYKTTRKLQLDIHLFKHPEAASVCKLSTCLHCSAKFKKQVTLHNHILKKHPDCIASV